ncbi:MAG: GtrA family protein, partial [Lachnospiraceae bacterium]|nr:GtrA family protein [Lachnospiraceae bacterium]
MKKIIDKFNSNEIFRYLVAGGMTTMVNLIIFTILRYGIKLSLTKSNFIAITCAILFAFFINKYYAFKTETKKKSEIATEFVKFVGGRLFSMLVEIVGVYVIAVWMGLSDMIAKLATQFVVVIINYLISKLIVFKKSKDNRTILDWMKDNLLYELAFILPLAIFIYMCITRQMA